MDWLGMLPSLGLAVLLFLVPGCALGISLGYRGFSAIALAPIFSVSLVVVAAILQPYVGLQWSPFLVGALTIMACALVYVIGKVWPTPRIRPLSASWWTRSDWQMLVGAAFGGIILSAFLVFVIGNPQNISQTYDNIFHLNAVQYIVQTGAASPFKVGGMTGIPFYPAAWHDVVSLVAEMSGTSIPMAVNATNLAIVGMVWPLASVWLATLLLGANRMVAAASGIVSAAFGAFPIMMVDFGVLYPNLLSIALLPAFLALGAALLGRTKRALRRRWISAGAVILAAPGLALAHPSTLMAAIALLWPPAIYTYIRIVRGRPSSWSVSNVRRRVWATVALVLAICATLILWLQVRPEEGAAFWPPIHSVPGAVLGLILQSEISRPPAYAASILVVVGLVVLLLRPSTRWIAGSYGVACLLFLVVSSFRPGRLRDFLTAIWYNDSYRLAALLPVMGVVVASAGIVALAGLLERAWNRGKPIALDNGKRHAVAGAAVLALALFAMPFGSVAFSAAKAHETYQFTSNSPLITTDELAVLKDVDKFVPAGAVVATNAWNGSALVYALADRTPIQFHVLSGNFSLDDKIVLDDLRDADTNPQVCQAATDLKVSYVLDFGSQEINGGNHPAPGITAIGTSHVVTLLSKHGAASLYKFDGC